jgi:hypothetical protein
MCLRALHDYERQLGPTLLWKQIPYINVMKTYASLLSRTGILGIAVDEYKQELASLQVVLEFNNDGDDERCRTIIGELHKLTETLKLQSNCPSVGLYRPQLFHFIRHAG